MVINFMGREWEWPDYDNKLRAVNGWVTDADEAIAHCAQRRVAMQAGGACGVWPWYLSKHFRTVYTFEPEPGNYECLTKNLEGQSDERRNIISRMAALSNDHYRVGLENPGVESDNAGTWHISGDGGISVITLDFLNLHACDLICLDVEGFEKQALEGATETISKFKPVVMLEEKQLSHMKGPCSKAREFLEQEFGYQVVSRPHRDVVMKPC